MYSSDMISDITLDVVCVRTLTEWTMEFLGQIWKVYLLNMLLEIVLIFENSITIIARKGRLLVRSKMLH